MNLESRLQDDAIVKDLENNVAIMVKSYKITNKQEGGNRLLVYLPEDVFYTCVDSEGNETFNMEDLSKLNLENTFIENDMHSVEVVLLSEAYIETLPEFDGW